jgi:hypothetical protein
MISQTWTVGRLRTDSTNVVISGGFIWVYGLLYRSRVPKMERKVPLDQFIQHKGGINACAAMSAARRRRGIFHW